MALRGNSAANVAQTANSGTCGKENAMARPTGNAQ